MTNPKEDLKRFCRELNTELGMRQKVWQKIQGFKSKFFKPEHDRRYKTMLEMLEVFKEMTPRELQAIQDRIKRKKEEENKEVKTLF